MLQRKQAILILILAGAAVYLQSIPFGYVQLDDPHHLFENPDFIQPRIATLFRYWIEPFFGLYIPTTYSVWWGISNLSLSPQLFHAVNALLHCLNGILVFLIVNRYASSRFSALLGALIFLLHPIQVEAVCWISGMKDVLFSLFLLLALLVRTQSTQKHSSLISTALFFFAVTSKPTAMIGPMVLMLLLKMGEQKSWRESFRASLPWWLISIPIFGITKWLQSDAKVQDLTPLWTRPLVALDALGFYLTKWVWPWGFALDYGRSPKVLMEHHFVSGYLLIGLVAVASLIYFLNRRQKTTFIWVFALSLIALLPNSGLIAFQFQLFSTVADRYAYFSLLGIALAVSHLDLGKKQLTASVACITLMAVLSFQQITRWKNDVSLFESALKVNPNSFLAHNNYGFYLFHTGNTAAAAHHLEKVVQLRPNNAALRMNFASALAKSGNVARAIAEFREAIALEPGNVAANFHLGRLLVESGHPAEGRRFVQRATELEPQNSAMREYLKEIS